MILFIFFVISIRNMCATNELSMLTEMDPNYGKTWMFLPDGDLNPQIAYLVYPNTSTNSLPGSMKALMDENGEIYYYLYRKKSINDPKVFKMDDDSHTQVLASTENYDPSIPTKMVIHGWKNTYKSPVGQKIKDATLSRNDANVFVVDWSSMADDNFYVRSASATRKVGFKSASLIDYLVEKRGAKLDDIHIIGHSLGAHTAGFTGAHTNSGKVQRITGLDPAKPLFTENNPQNRLDPSDAQFVDVIHTCSGIVGTEERLGTVDFWPNGGSMSQPGCSYEIAGTCSHGRAYDYFAESISGDTPFQAYPCSNYSEFKKGRCLQNPVYMGYNVPRTAKGSYYLMTKSRSPFALVW